MSEECGTPNYGALCDLKVLDLTHYVAGPYCTRLLAGLGAEVIKVEKPDGGDGARNLGPFPGDVPHREKSGLFHYLNGGKRSVTLDLKTATGRKLFLKMVEQANVLVESFRPGVMEGFGLSYGEISKVNPALVMTSISNFGQTGPYRHFRGTEITAFAVGGMMYFTGDPERAPLKNGGTLAMYITGSTAFAGTLGAVHGRSGTGIGQHVDVSMMECIAGVIEHGAIMWSYMKEIRQRNGNRSGQHPWGLYPCKDGWVAVVGAPDYYFERLPQLTGREEFKDPKFRGIKGRNDNADEIDGMLLPWLLERSKFEVYREGQALRLPFGYLSTMKDLPALPQFQSRGYFVVAEHPETKTFEQPGAPYIMGETPWRLGRAPLLGEHNAAVFCGILGLSQADLVRLRQQRVI